MNVTTLTIDDTARLEFARAGARAARQRLKDATRMRDLGQKMNEEAKALVKTHAESAEAADAAHAEAIKEFIASGAVGQTPTMTDNSRTTKDARGAARSLSVTTKAVQDLQEAVTAATADVEQADGAVRKAAMQILKIEAEALAAEIEAREASLLACSVSARERLAALDLALGSSPGQMASMQPNGLWNVPVLQRVASTPDYAPTNHYQLASMNGPWRSRIAEAEKAYRAQLAALIAGTPDQAAA
jgi:hypothetical protein